MTFTLSNLCNQFQGGELTAFKQVLLVPDVKLQQSESKCVYIYIYITPVRQAKPPNVPGLGNFHRTSQRLTGMRTTQKRRHEAPPKKHTSSRLRDAVTLLTPSYPSARKDAGATFPRLKMRGSKGTVTASSTTAEACVGTRDNTGQEFTSQKTHQAPLHYGQLLPIMASSSRVRHFRISGFLKEFFLYFEIAISSSVTYLSSPTKNNFR